MSSCSAQYQVLLVLLVLFMHNSPVFDTVKHVRFDCSEDFCSFRANNMKPNSRH